VGVGVAVFLVGVALGAVVVRRGGVEDGVAEELGVRDVSSVVVVNGRSWLVRT
jgi:hypothetical protein